MQGTMHAKVKLVNSGDTIVLAGKPRGNQPPLERTLSLAWVSAPRLRREGDEPWAFFSREFLRKLLVGKEVDFVIHYTVPTSQREYGTVFLNGQDILQVAVKEGVVRLRDDAMNRDEEILEILKGYEDVARKEERGIWRNKDSLIVKYDISEPTGFLEEFRGREVDAIIEQVRSGDQLRARLLLSGNSHQMLPVIIAGIRAPNPARDDNNELGEEFGDQAKWFVEQRLLQRTVKITLLGTNQSGNLFIGLIKHPAGNIAEALLNSGLARCVDWMSSLVGNDMAALRNAERAAKEIKLNLWKGHIAKTRNLKSFDATVFRIQNGDTLDLLLKSGEEKRVQLSSIRQPKAADPTQAAWLPETKEFLRKKIIGKTVHVTIDYTKPANEGFEERDCATIIQNGQNIALKLVEGGRATVVRHRKDDEDRSPIYDQLLSAELESQTSQKGIFSIKPPVVQRIVDASETATRAKSYLSTFQRQKRMTGTVEFVSSASRFKILLGNQNVKILLVLSNIRSPRSEDPHGPESLRYSVHRVLQRDVEVSIEGVDRNGGFIGTLYLKGLDFGESLLEQGWGYANGYNIPKKYSDLQTAAKEGKKGLWVDYVDAVEETPVGTRMEEVQVIVTDVDDEGALSVQIVGDGVQQLDRLMKEFRSFHAGAKPPSSKKLRNGELVAARFSEDGLWYRAKVVRVAGAKVDVKYIDYGNTETLPQNEIRELGDPRFGSLPGQAQAAAASHLRLHHDYLAEYKQFLGALADPVAAVVESREGGVLRLDLQAVAAELVREGIVSLKKGAGRELVLAMDAARRERRGVWEYGDVAGSDDE